MDQSVVGEPLARSFLRAPAKFALLISYGPSQEEYFPRAVQIADRILRGDKVADVPIERPSKFEFVVKRSASPCRRRCSRLPTR